MFNVSRKGQIVIPANLRKKYNIKPGMKVSILDRDGKIIIFPSLKDPINEAWGMLKGKISLTRELLESRKEEELEKKLRFR